MYWTAEELIAPGGPSAPVWAFLTTITLATITLLIKAWTDRIERREDREALKANTAKTEEAAEAANVAVTNTRNISNGFARGVNTKLDTLIAAMDDVNNRLSEHIAWHDEQEKNNGAAEQR